MFWVAMGYAANAMYFMVANYLFVVKKTHLLAMVTVFTGVTKVELTYLLIQANGAIGAAQASAIAFFLSFLLTWIISARAYPMPWRFWRAHEIASDQGLPGARGTR